ATNVQLSGKIKSGSAVTASIGSGASSAAGAVCGQGGCTFASLASGVSVTATIEFLVSDMSDAGELDVGALVTADNLDPVLGSPEEVSWTVVVALKPPVAPTLVTDT